MMKQVLDEDLIYEILSVVEEIPEGKVATYGQIARLIAERKMQGWSVKFSVCRSFMGNTPGHRVVNHAGRLAPGWAEQRFLLEDEGVALKDAHHVDLKKYLWDC